MTPRLRRLALTAHVASSVGWLGAVASFLVLALAGQDPAMDLVARFVVVPLALGSLATGVVSSLGTSWGLFRHYWVVAKLALTVVATAVLLTKLPVIRLLARGAEASGARLSMVVHAGGGLVVLLVATVLGIYKPRGLTPYGRRKEPGSDAGTPGWVRASGFVVAALVALRLLLHLAGHGPHGH